MEDRKPNKVAILVGENIPRIHADCAEIEGSVVDPSIDRRRSRCLRNRLDNELLLRWQNTTQFCDKLPLLEIWFAS